jgi:hypothetical protein
MTTSRTTLRIITLILFLAGLMLLQKPIFSQTITAAPLSSTQQACA